jgi:hypothetical protein
MAREAGIYRRDDSRLWWIATTLSDGRRIRQSAGTEDRREAEALLAQLKVEAYREAKFGIKPRRSWQEAVVRYLIGKQQLRSFADVQRICRRLDPYLGKLSLSEITGDVIWQVTQQELKRGNQPATVNRYLATIRNLLRIARDEWQWIGCDELKDLGGWKSRVMVDRYAKFGTEHLTAAAARIERKRGKNVISLSRFCHGQERQRVSKHR